MFRLVYSNTLPSLAEALAERLKADSTGPGRDPLDPVWLLLPESASQTYLPEALARALGVSAIQKTMPLHRFLRARVEEATQKRVATRARIAHSLLQLFGHLPKPLPEALNPLSRTLQRGSGPQTVAETGARAGDLAEAVAAVFDGYLRAWPPWIQAWRDPQHRPQSETEAWQAWLWRALPSDFGLHPLVEALASADPEALALPNPLYLFDLDLEGPAMAQCLARLSQLTELYAFALNPSMAFWEDLRTQKRVPAAQDQAARSRSEADPFDLEAPGEPLLLQLWGRPKREATRLLNQLSEQDFEPRFARPEGQSLLADLQREVLYRSPSAKAPGDAGDDSQRKLADGSLALWRADSPREEAEAIASDIWLRLKAATPPGEAPLQMSDIGIALATEEASIYRSELKAAFYEHHDLPLSTLRVPLTEESRVLDWIELWLELPRSAFSRQDLLRLALHPALFRPQHAASEDWLRQAESLGVYHGKDRRDHQGSYVTADVYSWDQGLKRLELGLLLGESLLKTPTPPFELGGEPYLPVPVPIDATESAVQFIQRLRSLLDDADYAQNAELSLSDWCLWLSACLDSYLGVDPEPSDARDLADIQNALATLRSETEAAPGQTPRALSLDAAKTAIWRQLRAITRDAGRPLAEAVTLAPLAHIKDLPFRVVYLPGLHEGAFPASDPPSQLDLREQAGGPPPIRHREEDHAHLLARLLATNDAVILSYVGRNPKNGDPMLPSTAILSLMDALGQTHLAPGAVKALEHSAGAIAEAETLSPRAQLRAQRSKMAPLLRSHSLDALKAELPERDFHALLRWMKQSELPPPPSAALPTAIPLYWLSRFLDDPSRAWMQRLFGRKVQPDEDPKNVTREPFSVPNWQEGRWLAELLRGAQDDTPAPLLARFEAQSARLQAVGALPGGVFAEARAGKLKPALKAIHGALKGLGGLHPPERFERGVGAHPLRVGETGLRIFGETAPQLSESGGSVFVRLDSPVSAAQFRRIELEGFVDLLALVAAGVKPPSPYRVISVDNAGKTRETRLACPSQELAQNTLWELSQALLEKPHAIRFQAETAHQLQKAKAEGKSEADLQRLLVAPPPPLSAWLPRFEPPSLAEAERILETRYALFAALKEKA